jgi:tetratricopeptide (TPR) repeat protein
MQGALVSAGHTGIAELPFWPFMAAAAVLTDFAADKLRPLGGGPPNLAAVGQMLIEHAEPIRIGPAKGRWSLIGTSRSAVLAELKRSNRLSEALEANRVDDRPDNPTQWAVDSLIERGQPSELPEQPLAGLLGFERAVELLRPCFAIPRNLHAGLLARIDRLRLLEPLQRLMEHGFAGRERESRTLREYIDELQSQSFKEMLTRRLDNVLDIFRARPLLVIWGPGGVGKSTLIAKFLLDHAGPGNPSPTPFVYLDFDRGMLDPLKPDTLLAEALRQIEVQFPEFADRAASLSADSHTRFRSANTENVSRSAHYGQSSLLRDRFAELVGEISAARNSNLLFFIDTFEIVQRRGLTSVYNVLALTAALTKAMPRLRAVIVGRAAMRDSDFYGFAKDVPRWKSVALEGFDAASGRLYLQGRLSKLGIATVDPAALDRIVLLVRGNPLSLRLAARVFAKNGITALEGAVDEARFEASLTEERLQGVLHNRIVANLEEPLRRIADPGLIVRRLTPDVIQHVLAGPCEIEIASATQAADMFNSLQAEVSLFEASGETTLRHRPDVRLLMLPLLRAKIKDRARAIDSAAVTFWSRMNSPEARAEEIYHLLWLDADTQELDSAYRKGPVSKSLLEDALDEFEALDGSVAARFWLCRKLEREMSNELAYKADLAQWEQNAARQAHNLIESGSPAEALTALRARPARTPTSPLWCTEIEALKLLGRDAEGLEVTARALAAAVGCHEPEHVLNLVIQEASLLERMGRRDEAWESAIRAGSLAVSLQDKVRQFEAKLMQTRLTRLLGSAYNSQYRADLLEMLDMPIVREAIARRPALSLEASAEVGDLRPELFIFSASPVAAGGSDRAAEALGLLRIGVAHAQRAEVDAAQSALQRAHEMARQLGDAKLLARVLVQLADVEMAAGRIEDASAHAGEAVALSQTLNDPKMELQARGAAGNVFVAKGELDPALHEYSLSLAIARGINDRLGEGNALGNIANVHLYRGDPRQAIPLLQQDLRIAEELGDRHGERQTLGSLATAYRLNGDMETALEFYLRSLGRAKELGDLPGQATTLNNLAALCTELSRVHDAKIYLLDAIKINEALKNVNGQFDTLGILASAFRMSNDLGSALMVYKKQMALASRAQDPVRRQIAEDNHRRTSRAMQESAAPAVTSGPRPASAYTPAPAEKSEASAPVTQKEPDTASAPEVEPIGSTPSATGIWDASPAIESKGPHFAELIESVKNAQDENESLIHQVLSKEQ